MWQKQLSPKIVKDVIQEMRTWCVFTFLIIKNSDNIGQRKSLAHRHKINFLDEFRHSTQRANEFMSIVSHQ